MAGNYTIRAEQGATLRLTLTFDPAESADRDRIARVYRHGRVLEHESRDGRISIVAEVPRRLTGLLKKSAP